MTDIFKSPFFDVKCVGLSGDFEALLAEDVRAITAQLQQAESEETHTVIDGDGSCDETPSPKPLSSILLSTYRGPLLASALLHGCYNAGQILAAYLFHLLLLFVLDVGQGDVLDMGSPADNASRSSGREPWEGIVLAVVIPLLLFAAALLNNMGSTISQRTFARMSSALTVLVVSHASKCLDDDGSVSALLTEVVETSLPGLIGMGGQYLHLFWSAPLIVMSVTALFCVWLSWAGALPLAVLFGSMFLLLPVAVIDGLQSGVKASATNSRIASSLAYFDAIRVVRGNSWTAATVRRICQCRSVEEEAMFKAMLYRMIMFVIASLTSEGINSGVNLSTFFHLRDRFVPQNTYPVYGLAGFLRHCFFFMPQSIMNLMAISGTVQKCEQLLSMPTHDRTRMVVVVSSADGTNDSTKFNVDCPFETVPPCVRFNDVRISAAPNTLESFAAVRQDRRRSSVSYAQSRRASMAAGAMSRRGSIHYGGNRRQSQRLAAISTRSTSDEVAQPPDDGVLLASSRRITPRAMDASRRSTPLPMTSFAPPAEEDAQQEMSARNEDVGSGGTSSAGGGGVLRRTLSVSSRSLTAAVNFNSVSLSIPSKGITVLVGPTGCGKSTLLKMIAGEVSLDLFGDEDGGESAGHCNSAGSSISDAPFTKHRTASYFVETGAFNEGLLTTPADDEVESSPPTRRITTVGPTVFMGNFVFDGSLRENITATCDDEALADESCLLEAIRQSRINTKKFSPFSTVGPNSVSGGESLRISLARALYSCFSIASAAKNNGSSGGGGCILLLDEPVSALDPDVADEFIQECLVPLRDAMAASATTNAEGLALGSAVAGIIIATNNTSIIGAVADYSVDLGRRPFYVETLKKSSGIASPQYRKSSFAQPQQHPLSVETSDDEHDDDDDGHSFVAPVDQHNATISHFDPMATFSGTAVPLHMTAAFGATLASLSSAVHVVSAPNGDLSATRNRDYYYHHAVGITDAGLHLKDSPAHSVDRRHSAEQPPFAVADRANSSSYCPLAATQCLAHTTTHQTTSSSTAFDEAVAALGCIDDAVAPSVAALANGGVSTSTPQPQQLLVAPVPAFDPLATWQGCGLPRAAFEEASALRKAEVTNAPGDSAHSSSEGRSAPTASASENPSILAGLRFYFGSAPLLFLLFALVIPSCWRVAGYVATKSLSAALVGADLDLNIKSLTDMGAPTNDAMIFSFDNPEDTISVYVVATMLELFLQCTMNIPLLFAVHYANQRVFHRFIAACRDAPVGTFLPEHVAGLVPAITNQWLEIVAGNFFHVSMTVTFIVCTLYYLFMVMEALPEALFGTIAIFLGCAAIFVVYSRKKTLLVATVRASKAELTPLTGIATRRIFDLRVLGLTAHVERRLARQLSQNAASDYSNEVWKRFAELMTDALCSLYGLAFCLLIVCTLCFAYDDHSKAPEAVRNMLGTYTITLFYATNIRLVVCPTVIELNELLAAIDALCVILGFAARQERSAREEEEHRAGLQADLRVATTNKNCPSSGMDTSSHSDIADFLAKQQSLSVASASFGSVKNNNSKPLGQAPQLTFTAAGLSMRYSPAAPLVLSNVAFAIPTGTMTLITGPSGCGKTSLFLVLLGLYGRQGGDVSLVTSGGTVVSSIDDMPLITADSSDAFTTPSLPLASSWRSYFVWVPQEPYFFEGSILQNMYPDEVGLDGALADMLALERQRHDYQQQSSSPSPLFGGSPNSQSTATSSAAPFGSVEDEDGARKQKRNGGDCCSAVEIGAADDAVSAEHDRIRKLAAEAIAVLRDVDMDVSALFPSLQHEASGNASMSSPFGSEVLVSGEALDSAGTDDGLSKRALDNYTETPSSTPEKKAASALTLSSPVTARGANLSAGERQRIGIARALLARTARVLLMDEPTSFLEGRSCRQLLERVKRTAAGRGMAVLVISHQVSDLSDVGDYVLAMADGRVDSFTPTANTV